MLSVLEVLHTYLYPKKFIFICICFWPGSIFYMYMYKWRGHGCCRHSDFTCSVFCRFTQHLNGLSEAQPRSRPCLFLQSLMKVITVPEFILHVSLNYAGLPFVECRKKWHIMYQPWQMEIKHCSTKLLCYIVKIFVVSYQSW